MSSFIFILFIIIIIIIIIITMHNTVKVFSLSLFPRAD